MYIYIIYIIYIYGIKRAHAPAASQPPFVATAPCAFQPLRRFSIASLM